MKTITTSNWKPQCRVLWILLLGITALWAIPRSAQAQLYVSQNTANTVGKYDATTGTAINASFITGRGLSLALAVSGNNLFVATNATTVPEPSTWSMIAMGGVALLRIMDRKKHRTA